MGRCRTIAVLAVMTAATALLYGVVSSRSDDGEKRLYRLDKTETIETICLENRSASLKFWKNEDQQWMVKEAGLTGDERAAAEYSAGAEKMNLLLDALSGLTVTRWLDEENPEYGLSGEGISSTVTFTTSQGNHYGFTAGNQTMTRSHVYIRDVNSGQTAITDLGAVAQLGGGVDSFRSRAVFRVDMDQIRALEYRTGQARPLILEQTGGRWQMKAPYVSPAREIEITELLSEMKDWNLCAFASSTAYSREQMGLSGGGSVLTLTDALGNTQTLEIGKPVDGLVPVRNGEKDDILLLYADEVNLEYLNADKLLFFAPLKADVDQVKGLQLEVDGTVLKFALDSEHNQFYCNGIPVDPEAFYSFYMSYMAMTAVGGDSKEPEESGAQLASLTTEYKDGSVKQVRLVQRDTDTCYMVVNNSYSGFYTSHEKLMTLISKLNRLANY